MILDKEALACVSPHSAGSLVLFNDVVKQALFLTLFFPVGYPASVQSRESICQKMLRIFLLFLQENKNLLENTKRSTKSITRLYFAPHRLSLCGLPPPPPLQILSLFHLEKYSDFFWEREWKERPDWLLSIRAELLNPESLEMGFYEFAF